MSNELAGSVLRTISLATFVSGALASIISMPS
jgi:hypothetical protein